jgi:hypothetical protein
MMFYTVKDHYWIINGSKTQVFSSYAKGYVPVDDPRYIVWLANGNLPTRIESEVLLWDVLAEQAPDCLPVITAGTDARKAWLMKVATTSETGKTLLEVLFNLENRIRILERKSVLTKADFLNAVKEML